MVAEGRLEEIAMAEGADWHFAVGELNKAQITALSAAERVMREKAEAEAATMKTKVRERAMHACTLCSGHRTFPLPPPLAAFFYCLPLPLPPCSLPPCLASLCCVGIPDGFK